MGLVSRGLVAVLRKINGGIEIEPNGFHCLGALVKYPRYAISEEICDGPYLPL
jgi:hypothetical protein